MMRRLTILVSAMAIGLAMPVLGEQTSADQDARHAAESFVAAFNKAVENKDAAALATLYTEGAFIVAPTGTISGRAAIEKSSEEGFKVFTESAKLERIEVLSKGIRVRSGSWAGTFQAPDGPRASEILGNY
jgi:ketosteroid isomerase-like protein